MSSIIEKSNTTATNNNNENDNITIRIKTTNSSKEITLNTNTKSTVDELKKQVSQELDIIGDDKYIRLISCGKMLTDGHTLSSFHIKNGSFIHCVVSDKKVSNNNDNSNNSNNNNNNNGIEMASINNLHGLDLLLAEGLTIDEVAAIRSYFRSNIDDYASRDERLQIREGESNINHRARIEEAWMTAQPPNSEFILNLPLTSHRRLGFDNMNGNQNPLLLSLIRGFVNQQSNRDNLLMNNSSNNIFVTTNEDIGTTRDFFFGICFGIFFGFISLLCVWDHNIPFRQKVGILIGVMIQLIMGTLVNSQNPNQASGNNNSNVKTTTNTVDAVIDEPLN